MTNDCKALTDLQTIPGVGKSIAQDLLDLGIRRVSQLRGKNPERLYQRFMKLQGRHIDRCVLYTFRCAIYFASKERHESKKLKWWNWKDAINSPTRPRAVSRRKSKSRIPTVQRRAV